MKKFILATILVPVLLSACSSRTHASTGKEWDLELTKAGTPPAATLTYHWKNQTRLSCRLEIQASSGQVDVPDNVTLILSTSLVDDNDNRTVLSMQLEDLISGTGKRPALWTKPVAFEWVITKRGRTLSFHQDTENVPVVLSGLPDLALLVSRMVPTFPIQKIGSGAVWSRRSSTTLTIPGPTGTGNVQTKDDITYELSDSNPGHLAISAKGTARYRGKMHPVGHLLNLDGRGSFSIQTRIEDGLFKESSLEAKEKIDVTADGTQRTIHTHYKARLSCRTAMTSGAVGVPHSGQLSQRFVSPKAIGRNSR